MTPYIRTEKQDHVMRIVFNRPEKKNAITFEMYDAIAAALKEASADPQVRVALVHGSAEAFTSGNDLGDFLNKERPEPPPSLAVQEGLIDFDKPLVAAVGGVAVGIGTTMLLHCDFVYCTANTRFALPFVNLALVPEAASSFMLARLAGWQRAAELLMLGEPFGADKARDIGLVNDIVAPDQLVETALAMAQRLAQKPPAALRATKALMKRPYLAAARDSLGEEMRLFRERLKSPEAKEAMGAFFEKRKPDFSRFS
jgi:enoyl-CoA hydratase/carnithine racemase